MDREKTILAVNEAVKAGRNELDLEAEGCYRTVSLWESDEHLKDLCDAMNSRREKSSVMYSERQRNFDRGNHGQLDHGGIRGKDYG